MSKKVLNLTIFGSGPSDRNVYSSPFYEIGYCVAGSSSFINTRFVEAEKVKIYAESMEVLIPQTGLAEQKIHLPECSLY